MLRLDMTTEEVAARAGILPRSLIDGRGRGDIVLPARGSGPNWRRLYFREEDVEAWLEERRKPKDRRRHAARDSVIAGAASAGIAYAVIADVHGLTLSTVSGIAIAAGHRNRPHRSAGLRREAVAYAREHGFDIAAAHFGVCRRSLFIWAKRLDRAA